MLEVDGRYERDVENKIKRLERVVNCRIADSASQTHHPFSVNFWDSELAGKARKLENQRLGRGGSKAKIIHAKVAKR